MNPHSQPSQFVQEMRPTLIVGLGGTGQEVLVRIKARFLETFGLEALELIKLVALDTVVEGFQVPLADGQTIRLDRNTELLDIGNVPTVQVLRNLDYNYPQIKAWLPKNLPGQAIVAGARQIRPMGRLAFFFHFKRIRDYLDNIINKIANINLQYQSRTVKAEDVEGIHIFVVSSLCGGTGSGIFLDTAYLIRYLCERLNQPNIHLTGILVLPQAFLQVPSEQIKGNTYAGLLELDQFSSGSFGNNFQVEYPGDIVISNPTRPFNICYLVDGVNERGRTLAGMSELAPMIAESIFLQISSRIGRQTASAFDNIRSIDGVFTDHEGITHPTAYSGFGMSSLIFPAPQIIDVCARRLAARLISQGLLGNTPTADEIKAEVGNFLERNQLREDLVLAAVSRDANQRPIALRPDQRGLSQAALETLNKNELLSQVVARAKAFENNVLSDSIRKDLEQSYTQLQASLQRQLDADIARLLSDPGRGIPLAGPFLENLRKVLSETVNRFDRTRREKQEMVARNTSAIEVNLQRLSQALEALLDVGGRKRRDALVALLNAYTSLFTMQFDIMRLDSAIRLLSVLITQIDDQRREIDILTDQLRSAADQFQKFDTERTLHWNGMQGASEQIITDSADLDTLYNTYVTDIGQQITHLTEPAGAGQLHLWRKQYPTYKDISEAILKYTQSVFSPIASIRLEDEVMRKRDVMAPEQRLEQLRSTSIPFWSFQMARVPEGGVNLETISVVAVENKDATIFREETMLRGTVTTTTLDKHRITVLQTRHGIPISALAQIDDYRRVYDQYTKRRSVPLHTFAIYDPRKARMMFGLGEAFGLITHDATSNYALQFNDPNRPQVELGKGLEEALRQFMNTPEYVGRLEELVETVVRDKGEAEAKRLVQEYLDRPMSSGGHRQEIERELKFLVNEYRQNYL